MNPEHPGIRPAWRRPEVAALGEVADLTGTSSDGNLVDLRLDYRP
jgi:hypothetical protein